MDNKESCIMPECPFCPFCEYGFIKHPDEEDQTFVIWHCLLDIFE